MIYISCFLFKTLFMALYNLFECELIILTENSILKYHSQLFTTEKRRGKRVQNWYNVIIQIFTIVAPHGDHRSVTTLHLTWYRVVT